MTVVLNAYADESGIEGSGPYCVVAGYIASPKHWDTFNEAWRKVIEGVHDYGITEFKANEFFGRKVSRSKKSSKNPFVRLPDLRAFQLLEDLLTVIHDHRARITRCAVALNVSEFQALSWGERQYLTGGTWHYEKAKFLTSGQPTKLFVVPMHGFIGDALHHAKPADCKVHFLFDEQRLLEEGIIQSIKSLRERGLLDQPIHQKVGMVQFDVSESWPGIQAGDILAHLLYGNEFRRDKLGKERTYALIRLMGRDRWKMSIYGRKYFMQHLERKFTPEQLAQMRAVPSPKEKQQAKTRLSREPS